ncbi:MAG: ABC transporter ATP-binding protein [Anaerolineales bacterium]|nr:ABC transporter ATP-binding protein [Anaerolineales bacterium]
MSQHVIEVCNLHKRYGKLVAVDNLTFSVEEGEIFGMVGPNGAGKTTTIECIEGLRTAEGGEIRLIGMDPLKEHHQLVEKMGIQLQESGLPPRLRVGEALDLFASFYPDSADPGLLLETLGLTDKRRSLFAKLSGGQKQRLFIALSLINNPKIVFFDELTTGLDPQARRAMWSLVREIRDRGVTVFLTTHFMEEAEQLCDRVLIIDHGRLVALDTPEALIQSLGMDKRLIFTLPESAVVDGLESIPQVEQVERSGNRLVVYGGGARFASAVIAELENQGLEFLDLRTQQPTLEDVFLSLTGREIRE